MMVLRRLSPGALGAVCASLAVFILSVNDVVIKFLSGDYALHQVVLIRSVLGLVVILCVVAPFGAGLRVIYTKRPVMHMLRGVCVVFANMTFFLGLAAMELADAVAIFFISPLVITIFSMIFLNETVGVRRWSAIGLGFLGVLIVMRPGTDAFTFASLLPLAAAVFYATVHIITRRIAETEAASTMAFYIQLMFILISLCIGFAVGDGRFGDQNDPSLEFLLRAWSWPQSQDYIYFLIIGLGIGFGGILISQAYRVAEASFVAPFEYLALPMSVIWGILFFNEYPQALDYLGIALILGAGLFTVWREAQVKQH